MLYIVVETVRSYKSKHGSGSFSGDSKDVRPVSVSWIRLTDNLIDELSRIIYFDGNVAFIPLR